MYKPSGGVAYGRMRNWKPIPFRPKRKPPTQTVTGAPKRYGKRVRYGLKSKSYAQTQTRRRRRYGRVSRSGDNSSFSSNYIGGKAVGINRLLFKKLVAPQTVVSTGCFNQSSLTGLQASINATSMMSTTDLNTIKNAVGTVTGRPVQFYLKTGRWRLTIRNQTNCNARVSIYDIITKTTGVSTSIDDPRDTWAKGLADYSATYTRDSIGSTPYKSPEFQHHFMVHKVTTFSMEPGQQHEHSVWHKYNRLVSSNVFDNHTAESIQGLTRWCLVVFHGSLIHESASPGTVSFAPVTLDFAVHKEYSYSYMENDLPTLNFTDNVPKTITDPDQMAEDQDQDLGVNTA